MPVSLLLNLTENILTCESPIIQSLTIYSYEIKICPTQYSSEMAVILNGSEEPQVQDSGSGQHCHTYQCLLLQHWINHFSFFHAVVSSLTFTYSIYLHDKVYIYTTASPWIKYGLALFPLLPPVSACCGSHQEASQPNEQGRGYCVLHLISSCCWLKVQVTLKVTLLNFVYTIVQITNSHFVNQWYFCHKFYRPCRGGTRSEAKLPYQLMKGFSSQVKKYWCCFFLIILQHEFSVIWSFSLCEVDQRDFCYESRTICFNLWKKTGWISMPLLVNDNILKQFLFYILTKH